MSATLFVHSVLLQFNSLSTSALQLSKMLTSWEKKVQPGVLKLAKEVGVVESECLRLHTKAERV